MIRMLELQKFNFLILKNIALKLVLSLIKYPKGGLLLKQIKNI